MGLSGDSGFDFCSWHICCLISIQMLSELPLDMDTLGQPTKKFRLLILNNSD